MEQTEEKQFGRKPIKIKTPKVEKYDLRYLIYKEQQQKFFDLEN